MEELNKNLFLAINSFAGKSHLLDSLGIMSAEAMPYVFILIEVALYFVFKKKNEAIFAFMSMVMAIGLNAIIGLFYFHNRPFMDSLGTTLVQHAPDSSFPSDHTAFIFAIAIYLFMSLENKIITFTLLLLALIGGSARIFTGVHYPFDILGGIITALISSLIIYQFREKLQPINNLIFTIENKIFKRD